MTPCPRHSPGIGAILAALLATLAIGVPAFGAGPAGLVGADADCALVATIDKEVIRVGDLIHYTMSIEAPDGAQVAMPPPGTQLGQFLIRDFAETEPEKPAGGWTDRLGGWLMDRAGPDAGEPGRVHKEFRFIVTAYLTGDLVIPPMPVIVTLPDGGVRRLHSESARVRVAAFTNPEDLTIRDVKAPVGIVIPPRTYWPYLVGAGAALALLGAGLALVLRRRREEDAPLELRPPHQVALDELDALDAEGWLARGEPERHYTRLSYILRKYLASRYLFYALEHTTPEIVEELMLKDLERLDHDRVRALLEEADMVKFARYAPDPKDRDAAIGRARLLIERTRERSAESASETDREAA